MPDTIAEDGGVSVVTATVRPAAARAFTVTVSAQAVDPATAADFTLSDNTTLSFAAEATDSSGAVSVTAMADEVDAPDTQVTVSAAASGTGVTAPADVTLTVTDDDAPAWVVTVDPAAIHEDGGTATVTVSAGGVTFPDDRAIALSFGGDAAPGRDFTVADARGTTLALPPELTLAAGAGEVTATITAVDDRVDDNGERIVVTARYQGAAIGEPQTVTITDDEGTPVVTLMLSPDAITESGGVSVVTATVTPAAAQAFTVTVAAQAVAPATANFTLSDNTTLSFAAEAAGSSGVVTVTGTNDAVDAPDAKVRVSGAVSGASVSAPAAVMLTIVDDDAPAWAVTVDPAAIDEDGGEAAVTVSTGGITFPNDRAIALSFAGTALPGSDYAVADADGIELLSPYTLSLTSGESTVTARITALDDQVDDDAEQITITARHAAVVIGNQPTVTINDDDGEPSVALVLSPDEIAEDGGTSVVTATVAPAAAQAFTVTVTAAAVSPAADADFTLSGNATLSFAAAATESTGTVTVTAADNVVGRAGQDGVGVGDGERESRDRAGGRDAHDHRRRRAGLGGDGRSGGDRRGRRHRDGDGEHRRGDVQRQPDDPAFVRRRRDAGQRLPGTGRRRRHAGIALRTDAGGRRRRGDGHHQGAGRPGGRRRGADRGHRQARWGRDRGSTDGHDHRRRRHAGGHAGAVAG